MNSFDTNDTIVAIATPAGVGGIAVVRVSGLRALEIVSRLTNIEWEKETESHKAKLQKLYSESETIIDEALVLPMLGSSSYTGENTIEFFCHGGNIVANNVVSACVGFGARPATAGEFTRRAFLNGKLSLDQSEAVVDLIHAETNLAASAALGQLRGGAKKEILQIEQPLLSLLSELEGGLEFLDEEQPEMPRGQLAGILNIALKQISNLLLLAETGKSVRDGVNVVLVGAPNCGKSSLFNALLSDDRAIVDSSAGTTRDVISEAIIIDGLKFNLHDTAGVRLTKEGVEQKGIKRTHKSVADADIVLLLKSQDTEPVKVNSDSPTIVVGTKTDLASVECDVETSSMKKTGIEKLKNKLLLIAKRDDVEKMLRMGLFLNERHRHKLQSCQANLDDLIAQISENKIGDDIVATLLASTLTELGEISGRVYTESLLEDVFSKFCVGK